MTDNEIVKAWESRMYKENKYMFSLIQNTLDLINRLQAENERLQQYYDDMQSAIYEFREDHAKVKFFKKEIKTQAYKEFAERLKEKYGYYDWENKTIVYPDEEIDNLLKELIGE